MCRTQHFINLLTHINVQIIATALNCQSLQNDGTNVKVDAARAGTALGIGLLLFALLLLLHSVLILAFNSIAIFVQGIETAAAAAVEGEALVMASKVFALRADKSIQEPPAMLLLLRFASTTAATTRDY